MQYSEFNRHMISIHAPRRGERPTSFAMVANCTPFQSTLPAWGATIPPIIFEKSQEISIHAPRMGSDFIIGDIMNDNKKISIHAPRMGSDTK